MSSYRVLNEFNVKEVAAELKALMPSVSDFNNLEADYKQAEMFGQYIMIITDDRGTWWRFNADYRYSAALVFEKVKEELRLS